MKYLNNLKLLPGKLAAIARSAFDQLYPQKDKLWLFIYMLAISSLWVWDGLFLNAPALRQIERGFINTFLIAFLVIAFTLLLAWLTTLMLNYLQSQKWHSGYMTITFFLNLMRSVPQIIGVLFGYIWITMLIENQTIGRKLAAIPILAFIISLFVFIELVDLMRERISHYKKLDFYNAMLVCGISEKRIINFDILWKNSRVHIFNKLIAIFGMAVFLLCSVDFIISVGLSTDVSAVNLPATLGSLLAKIDSKQDILAIGHSLTHPGYFPNIFFAHLQGISVAFLIVISLFSIYKISNGFAERHRL